MERVYVYRFAFFLTYWVEETFFKNKYFNNADWFIREEWNIAIGLRKKLFEIEDLYYDGHTVKGFTILGLSITWGYTYDSRDLSRWTSEELISQE